MPTYDYTCKACGKSVEIFHSMSEVKRKCPACGKNALERQIGTGGAIIFKGSGFYQTDYRSEGYKKAKESESGTKVETKADSKPETAKGETKAESKPAAEPAKAKPEPKTKKSKKD